MHMIGPYAVILQHVALPILHVECAINAGFIHETEETAGINHLLEHVMTEAWKKCGTTSCNSLWMDRGVDMNASTDDTLVQYHVSGTMQNLTEMVEYITDISDHPLLKRRVLAKEKEAVIDEMSTYGSNPESKLDGLFNHAAFKGGLAYKDDWKLQIANLKHLQVDSVKKAYLTQYNPANMMYIVYGTFDETAVLAVFQRELQKRPGGAVVSPDCFTYAHKILYSHENTPTTKVVVGFPSAVQKYDDAAVFAQVICGILNHLFFQLLRTKLTLVYGVHFTRRTNVCGTMMLCTIYVREQNVVACMKALLAELKAYQRHPFPKEAVAAAKERESYAHYNDLPYTDDYLLQYMHQIGVAKPRIISNADKIRMIKKMSAATLLPMYRKLFVLEHALCVYQGARDVGLTW
jgi:predicted Zn-dependent peptidase